MADILTSTQSIIIMIMIAASFALAVVLPWKKKASATAVISSSIILVFVIQFLLTEDFIYGLPFMENFSAFDQRVLFLDLGFNPRTIVDDYSVYQFITSTYLHSGFAHLMFNFLGLFILGTQLEQRIGWERGECQMASTRPWTR